MVRRLKMIETADSEKDSGDQISVAWYSGTLRNSQPRSQSAAHIGPSFTVSLTVLSNWGALCIAAGRTKWLPLEIGASKNSFLRVGPKLEVLYCTELSHRYFCTAANLAAEK